MPSRRLALAVAVAAMALAAAPSAQAAIFDVTRLDDPAGGACVPGNCSLRQAVAAANAAGTVDVINLPAGTITLSQVGVDDTNVLGDVDITDSVTITGKGSASTIVDAHGTTTGDRGFDMPNLTTGKSVTISGMTVKDGRVSGGNNSGAGVRNGMVSGTLLLTNMIVSGNSTDTSGLGPVGEGGGVVEDDGVVTIQDSVVSGNTANFGGGATENGANTLNVVRSTISGNTAVATSPTVGGGGLSEDGAGVLNVTNSTIAGNNTTGGGVGGGIVESGGGQIHILFSTIAANTATSGHAIDVNGGGTVTVRDSIASSTAAGACAVSSGTLTSQGANLDNGTSCPFTAPADIRARDPLLGPLAANGGFAPTLALAPNSPAVNAAEVGAGCLPTDERGVARPQLAGCDIGAFELQPAAAATLPAPVLGKAVNVVPVKGHVFVSVPAKSAFASLSVPGLKGRKFVPLTSARQIPVGSFLDTRKGTVRLVSAQTAAGKTFTGNFDGGVFQVLQSRKRSKKGLTELRLKGSNFRSCSKSRKSAMAARSKKRVRKLRGNAKGRFRTRGRYSAATVRGTIWTVTDRCDGTLTQVKRGKVAVTDFRRHKTILVRKGKKYLAKAR